MSSHPTPNPDPCRDMWGNGDGRAEFATFMRSNTGHLYQNPRGSQSDNTRPPTTFDLHLCDSLLLKKVVFLNHLSDRISNAVDEQLVDLLRKNKRLPQPEEQLFFPTKEVREIASAPVSHVVGYEQGVTNRYLKTTGQWCCTAASTMVMHPSLPTWRSFLECTPDPESQSHGAIADLYLGISKTLAYNHDSTTRLLSKRYWKHWEAVRHYFPKLMTFEFKSLLSGGYPIMNQIKSFGDGRPFPWESCPGCGTHSSPPIKLSRDCQTPGRHLLSKDQLPYNPLPWYALTACPSPNPAVRRGLQQNSSRAGSEESDRHWNYSRSPTPDPHPVNKNGTPESDRLSARNILQQAWAQAVRNDGTFLAILAGNYEIIGIRHRESQTLYITDVVCVDQYPCYSRLHTGLFISVLKDADQRTEWITTRRYPRVIVTGGLIPRSLGIDIADSQGFVSGLTPDDYAARLAGNPNKSRKTRSSTSSRSIAHASDIPATADDKAPRRTHAQLPSAGAGAGPYSTDSLLPATHTFQLKNTPQHLHYPQTPPHTPNSHYQHSTSISSPTPSSTNNSSFNPYPTGYYPAAAYHTPTTDPRYLDVPASGSLPQSSLSGSSRRASDEKRSHHTNYSPYTTRPTQHQPKDRSSEDVTKRTRK